MNRTRERPFVAWLAIWWGLAVAACGEATKPPPPPPPSVNVATVIAPRRAALHRGGRHARRLRERRDPRARARLPAGAGLQGRRGGEGRGSCSSRSSRPSTRPRVGVGQGRASRARDARRRTTRLQLERRPGLFKTRHGRRSRSSTTPTAASRDADDQVQAAQAQLQQATLNLSYTEIRSPVDGVAGLAQVRVGNLVGQDGPTLLTTVSQVDPIRVNFPMSEVDYVKTAERFKQLDGRDLAWAEAAVRDSWTPAARRGRRPGVELVLADGSVYPHRGVIVAVNRQIDASTGTIQLQALVPQPRRRAAPRPVRARAHAAPRRGRRRAGRPGEGAHPGAGDVLARRWSAPTTRCSCARSRSGPARRAVAHRRLGLSRGRAGRRRGRAEGQRRRDRRRPQPRRRRRAAAGARGAPSAQELRRASA